MSDMNEIEAAALAAKRAREGADATQKTQRENANWPMLQIGLGVGGGSAALAAALPYPSRSS